MVDIILYLLQLLHFAVYYPDNYLGNQLFLVGDGNIFQRQPRFLATGVNFTLVDGFDSLIAASRHDMISAPFF